MLRGWLGLVIGFQRDLAAYLSTFIHCRFYMYRVCQTDTCVARSSRAVLALFCATASSPSSIRSTAVRTDHKFLSVVKASGALRAERRARWREISEANANDDAYVIEALAFKFRACVFPP